MYVQTVELAVRAGQETAFEAALTEVRQRVFMSAGFRGFTVAQGVARPTAYLVQVRWETLEELKAALESGRLDRCWAPVAVYLAEPMRAAHYVERTNLADQGPGVITDLSWVRD